MPEIDEYTQHEKEFLQKHWNGCEKQDVLQEINSWIDWGLKLVVSNDLNSLFEEIKERFNGETVRELRDNWSGFDERFVVTLDTTHATKSPGKILEKLVREWLNSNKPETPALNRYNFKTELTDCIRFRYEVNFLEDAEKLYQFVLEEAKDPSAELCKELALREDKCTCNVHDRLSERVKGERSWKFQFVHRKTRYQVELQICTQLQVAWDKKDHFLIYERRRRGMNVPEGDHILMKHVSDQLYVVDRQLDELRKKIEKELGQI